VKTRFVLMLKLKKNEEEELFANCLTSGLLFWSNHSCMSYGNIV